MKVIKIGFDMDGVIVDKPPFVPKSLLEWLVRSPRKKNLAYRFPQSKMEQSLRIFSHHPLFRPPLKKNLEFIKKLAKNKRYQLYLISSRYSFLENRTWQWLKKHRIDNLFASVFINLKNDQPHLFKKRILKKLKPDIFIDDDTLLAEYLAGKFREIKIYCFSKKSVCHQARTVNSLPELI